jgi:Zn-dependent oligopeptidase
VRKARYDLDQNVVKPYLQLEKLREAIHWAAGQLYGFTFTQITDVPVCHPDVRVWEVTKGGAQRVGLWYFDPYARAGKQSGAWMSEYRTQEKFKGVITPIVSNNCNFVKGKPGEPVLISWDDATTMFHEFGHALHGLNSDVTYPTLAGTNVARDFVEFPSQLNEHWLPTKPVLSQFAVHYQTGKPIPDELVAKIEKAKTFNQGFSTVEYLASAIYDMKIHLAAKGQAIDPEAFEKTALTEIGLPSADRHAPPAHPVRAHLLGRRLFGRLLQLHLGRHPDRRRRRGLRGGAGRLLRQGRGQAPARRHHERGQHHRRGRGFPPLPRPRREDRRPDAQPRLPGSAGSLGFRSRTLTGTCARGAVCV